jgi:hypothetical protein
MHLLSYERMESSEQGWGRRAKRSPQENAASCRLVSFRLIRVGRRILLRTCVLSAEVLPGHEKRQIVNQTLAFGVAADDNRKLSFQPSTFTDVVSAPSSLGFFFTMPCFVQVLNLMRVESTATRRARKRNLPLPYNAAKCAVFKRLWGLVR